VRAGQPQVICQKGNPMSAVLGQGVYTFREAARLVGLRPDRVREWFRGRGNQDGRLPVFAGDYEPVDGDFAISFLDLVDVFVAGQLREHGVALQTLRRVYKRMQQDLNAEHPFCRRELLSDGKVVFMQGLDAQGREELMEVLTRQKVFPEVLLPFLKRIDYEQVKLLARRWRIADSVVVDPAICFGKPVVEAVSIPTAVLASAYRANKKDADLVADWYGVHPDHVLAAVTFESNLAA
jgi:uncharacterized protein (DUF433 family)